MTHYHPPTATRVELWLAPMVTDLPGLAVVDAHTNIGTDREDGALGCVGVGTGGARREPLWLEQNIEHSSQA